MWKEERDQNERQILVVFFAPSTKVFFSVMSLTEVLIISVLQNRSAEVLLIKNVMLAP